MNYIKPRIVLISPLIVLPNIIGESVILPNQLKFTIIYSYSDMRRRILIFLLPLCMLFTACKDSENKNENTDNYRLYTVKVSDATLSSVYSATIRGKQDIEIRPQVSGLITEVCVSEGETVRKGQPLFLVDSTAYAAVWNEACAQVAVAHAELATAQLEARNQRILFQKEIISAHQMQVIDNELSVRTSLLAQAEAQLKHAANNLSYTIIRSPSDGVVGMLPYRIGSLVSPDITQPLTTVSDNREMYVYFSLTEKQIYTFLQEYGNTNEIIKRIPTVHLRLNNGMLYPDSGKVAAVSGVIDPVTGTAGVRAVFPNPTGMLLSGATGEIIIPVNRKDVLLLPQSATFEIQDKYFVYRVENGRAVSKEITVSSAGDGKHYIVESGLQAGDVVVAEGISTLREGTVVEP